MARIRPKHWETFQHYKDRSPSWIKLHRSLLDDFKFHRLPVDSRALAPMLWLLASEHQDGIIDADPDSLGFRLRMTSEQVTGALQPLIDADFFGVVQDAISPLAGVQRRASPEKEKQEEREEEERRISRVRATFPEFWSVCPKKVGEDKARKSFERAARTVEPESLVAAMRRYAASRAGQDERFTLHPATWLQHGHWSDELPDVPRELTPEEVAANKDRRDKLMGQGAYAPNYDQPH